MMRTFNIKQLISFVDVPIVLKPRKHDLRHYSNAYYVVLPELPPDTNATRAIMAYNDTPRFADMTPDGCLAGCKKLALLYEYGVGRHIDHLENLSVEKKFDSVFNSIETLSVPLNTALNTAKILYCVDKEKYQLPYAKAHVKDQNVKNSRWLSETLYYCVKEVAANGRNLSDFQNRLIEHYLLEGYLNGIELRGKNRKRFFSTIRLISKDCENFMSKVSVCETQFSDIIYDKLAMSEFPHDLLVRLAQDSLSPSHGPWKITLQQSSYLSFLEYCSNRTLRWNVWRAYTNRGALDFSDKNLDTVTEIKDICWNRSYIAKLLGYDNFAEMSMQRKMAGSLEVVLSMISQLKNIFFPIAHREIMELQKFAESEGFGNELQMWDIAYWRRLHRHCLFKLDYNEISEFFTMEKVLCGLFKMCHIIFGITITEDSTGIDTCHPDVRYFRLFLEQGEFVGSFFLDPFYRPGKNSSRSLMESGRERSELLKTTPYCYLMMNLYKPIVSSGHVLMHFSDVMALFREFGNVLQQLLNKVPYSELSGLMNIELDAAKICANFMQHWLMEPNFLQPLTSHFETGQSMPTDLLNRLLQSQHHLHAYDIMHQLYFSAFDMEMHSTSKMWSEVMQHLWPQFIPLPLDQDDNHPCSFTPIFSGLMPAAYYSHVWSRMVAADAFAAFKEEDLSNASSVRKTGQRFLDTFLHLAGGVPAAEVFRRFRGRDPSIEAFLQHHQARVPQSGTS